jgi:hypothetical protein
MTDEVTSAASTAAIQRTAIRLARAALKAAYAGETDEVLDAAAIDIVSVGAALLDASGKIRFMPEVAAIAPRLAPSRDIKGSHEEAKLARAAQITMSLAPLRRPAVTDVREVLAKIGRLPANATDAQKCARAAEVTNALQAAGIEMEDPNGG